MQPRRLVHVARCAGHEPQGVQEVEGDAVQQQRGGVRALRIYEWHDPSDSRITWTRFRGHATPARLAASSEVVGLRWQSAHFGGAVCAWDTFP